MDLTYDDYDHDEGTGTEQCSRRCGYVSGGRDLAGHERHEHADCPRCGAKAPQADPDGFACSVTHRSDCPRLAPGHRYEDEENAART